MRILPFLLSSTFAQNFNALSPGYDPDEAMTMFKEIYFPIFKASFTNLNHDKMHRQKDEDVGEMRFVERMFDYCVGEDDYFMSFEEDLACGTRMLTDMSKAFPELAELVEEDDPGKLVFQILVFIKNSRIELDGLRDPGCQRRRRNGQRRVSRLRLLCDTSYGREICPVCSS